MKRVKAMLTFKNPPAIWTHPFVIWLTGIPESATVCHQQGAPLPLARVRGLHVSANVSALRVCA